MTAPTTHPAIPPNARCVACGYSLYKLEVDRCPECGRGFDRNKPSSMGIKSNRSPWLLPRLERANSKLTTVIPALATFLLFVGSRVPSAATIETITGAALWFAFLLGHTPVVLLRRRMFHGTGVQLRRLKEDARLLKRVLILLPVSAFFLSVPVWAMVFFWLHHAEFEALASRVGPNMVSYSQDTKECEIGGYQFNHVGRFPAGISVETGGRAPSGEDPHFSFCNGYFLETDPTEDSVFRGWYLGHHWYAYPRF